MPDAGVEGVEANPVDELRRPLDIPDREIAIFAALETSDVIEASERARGLPRDGCDAFIDGQAKQRRAHVHRQQQRRQRRGAGVAVGGECYSCAVAPHRFDRRRLLLADEIERARQNHRNGAGPGHRRDAFVVGIFKMIGRKRAEARGKRGAVQVRELIGMKTNGQAERLRFRKDTRGLLRRERDAFAEGIDGIGEARRGDLRQHRVADRVDIGAAVALHLGRHRMRAEKGCLDRYSALGSELSRGLQLPPLGVEFEAIAGFDFDRGDAFGDQRVEPRQ